jgi:hypothetical protein
MLRRSLKLGLAAFALAAIGGGAWAWHESQMACCAFPDEPERVAPGERPRLGLMTSLPLYWPLGAEMVDIASGKAELPWQRLALERSHVLVPLDTLSPLPGLMPDDDETNPLEGLDRLAVIQPRGLSPADNVALDEWVREGGRLLLVLDPMLTGEYDLALGDPRRPTDMALIPPVVTRWGLAITFDDTQDPARMVPFGAGEVEVALAGTVEKNGAATDLCRIDADRSLARCTIGAGQVTLFADAAMFEGGHASEHRDALIQLLMDYAFENTEG